MKALIVYDSVYGNTELIARAIGDVLAARAEVRTVRVAEAQPEHLADLSLLVVGSPTHGSMASPATRAWLKSAGPQQLAWRQSRGFRHARRGERCHVTRRWKSS
jgi:flavodoxin